MGWRCDRVIALACVQLAFCLGVHAHMQESGSIRSQGPFRFVFAQLEEASKKESHEEFIENWLLTGLFIVIIISSIIFEVLVELLQECLRHRGLHKLQDMLTCAFKELTILGFISLFLYCATRLGAVRKLNDKYLGVSKTEEVAIQEAEAHGEVPYPPTHLTETFETIHVLIFMIMVAFIVQVAVLTAVGYRTMKELEYLDAKTSDDLRKDVTSLLEGGYGYKGSVRKALEHWGIKRRFISATNPLMPKPRRPEPGFPKFSFAAYLIHCFGESLSVMIELPPSILVLTLLIVVLLRPALSLPGREIIIFMVIAAFGLLLLTCLAYAFLKFADAKVRPDSGALVPLFSSQAVDPEASDKAFHCPIDDRPLATMKDWPRKHVVNRAAALFPFGNPRYYRRLLQLLLFFHAAYTAILLMCFFAQEHGSRYIWWKNAYWAYPLTLVPLCVSFIFWARLLKTFTTVFHVDFLANPTTIREVEAEQDKAVVQRDAQILEFLMHQVHHQKMLLGKLFESLDTDGNQRISLDELEKALSGMRPPISQSEILSLQQRISADGVNITEDSLCAWARRTRMKSRSSIFGEERQNHRRSSAYTQASVQCRRGKYSFNSLISTSWITLQDALGALMTDLRACAGSTACMKALRTLHMQVFRLSPPPTGQPASLEAWKHIDHKDSMKQCNTDSCNKRQRALQPRSEAEDCPCCSPKHGGISGALLSEILHFIHWKGTYRHALCPPLASSPCNSCKCLQPRSALAAAARTPPAGPVYKLFLSRE
ncbi:uncharacterized protein LOC113146556 [Cyclospora cayetanensis]|uniref:Uncharacterized protein LOC113146556 n=1 Tax=Cyclospora cayetanensis TaxID=88456 RepID=A0A6P6RR71_9EIME|nr:uncharacterized protein LOC113146556 [Cyclospora cayetanensis]